MVQVVVDSVKVSLISPHRVVVLKETEGERYLPIWIGAFEADAITLGMQEVAMSRPLTHDLLKNVIEGARASVSHIYVNELREDTFFAQIFLQVNGKQVAVDSRPSDAIALAVRVGVPIYVAEGVLEQAGILPASEKEELSAEEAEKLAPFKDFIDTLDLEDLDEG